MKLHSSAGQLALLTVLAAQVATAQRLITSDDYFERSDGYQEGYREAFWEGFGDIICDLRIGIVAALADSEEPWRAMEMYSDEIRNGECVYDSEASERTPIQGRPEDYVQGYESGYDAGVLEAKCYILGTVTKDFTPEEANRRNYSSSAQECRMVWPPLSVASDDGDWTQYMDCQRYAALLPRLDADSGDWHSFSSEFGVWTDSDAAVSFRNVVQREMQNRGC